MRLKRTVHLFLVASVAYLAVTLVMVCTVHVLQTVPYRQMQPRQQLPVSNNSARRNFDVTNVDREVAWNISGIPRHIMDLINKLKANDKDFFPDGYWTTTMDKLAKSLNRKRRKSGAAVLRKKTNTTGNWAIVDSHIRQYSLYDPDDPAVEALLKDMATLPIEKTSVNGEGEQFKLNVKFKGGGWALLKPMRYPRNMYKYIRVHYERHHAEIAAFHLDRILGTYRVPPTTGRRVNITSELAPVFPQAVLETVYTSEDGRICFYGQCPVTCKKGDLAFCGYPDTLEVSLMYFLPDVPYSEIGNPWALTWRPSKKQIYFCEQARYEYSKGNPLPLEELDAAYFDTLIGNYDRHSLYTFDGFNNDTVPFLFDNGRGFVLPQDHLSLEWQSKYFKKGDRCCLIKKTTFLKYLKLFLGPDNLSDLMRVSLRSDPVDPVLLEDHLNQLDRKVKETISYIQDCLENYSKSIDDVIIDDITPYMPRD